MVSAMDQEMTEELRNSLDQTGTLKVPDELKFEFETIDTAEVMRKMDRFNSLEQELPRQNSMKVKDLKDLVSKINTYDQEGDNIALAGGYCAAVLSLGCYWACNRRIVPDGKWGHYSSSGRHMILPPGVHTLMSLKEEWHSDLDMSSSQHEQTIGSKFLITVPENYIGGATKTSTANYVLFEQGRYVLDDADYQDIDVVPLKRHGQEDITKLGPINIVYVREGYIGGAYQIYKGQYEVLHPGPPYLLHEKEYENIQVVKRELDWFKMGPLTFITVREGMLGGAYHKQTGNFQILLPGSTYCLNEKDYEVDGAPELIERVETFDDPNQPGFVLGPYTFMTVKKGYVAGAFKVDGGDFLLLPPGHTYQLHKQLFVNPECVRKSSHIVTCGPLTFVTIAPGKLVGATRTEGGKFEEFFDTNQEYRLHTSEFHSLRCIDKYSFNEQVFGPQKVITIPEGYRGVFEREGELEIVEPGFYKKNSEYMIKPSIPIKVFTVSIPNSVTKCEFKSKDGADMSVTGSIVWQVTDHEKTALFEKGFEALKLEITGRFLRNMQKFAGRCNRDDLLPTTQDVIAKSEGKLNSNELDILLQKSNDAVQVKYAEIQEGTHGAMVDAAKDSEWGVTIKNTSVETCKLEDPRIISDIDQMCRSGIKTSLERYRGELAIFKSTTKKNTTFKKERTRLDVRELQAKSEVDVRKAEANGIAAVKKILSEVSATTDVLKQKARSEIQVLTATTEADANAKGRRIKLEIKNKERLETAKVEAEAIKLRSEALYEKNCKENDAIGQMTDKQYKLFMADKSISAMAEMGNASWKMPDQILQFYESFSPYLRMGPVTASEMLNGIADSEKSGNRAGQGNRGRGGRGRG